MRPLSWVIAPIVILAAFGVPAPSLRAQCPLLFTFTGEQPEHALGRTITFSGDVDSDGCDDILVGAFRYDIPGGMTNAGKAYLISGATGSSIREWVGTGGAFASRLDNGGDIDRDGTPDVIVAAHGFPTAAGPWAGRVYVYSGATGQPIWIWDGDRMNDQFGWSVAGPGDLNGDGHADVVIGQKGHDSLRTFGGRVHAFSGATGERLWSREGDAIGDQLGWSVAGAGDFNGDGTPDVVAGAPRNHPAYLYVYSGLDGSTLARIEYWDQPGSFGTAVAGVGDINADGYDDIVAGAYSACTQLVDSACGDAYLLGGPDARRLKTWSGEAPNDYFGYSVAGAGDVNGDAVPDVIIGAYGHWGAAGWSSGEAYVISGATGLAIQSWEGEAAGDLFGLAVGGGGDADGDGFLDALVATRYAAATAGKAYVFTPVFDGPCACWGRIDLADLRELANCYSGPARTGEEGCSCSDMDRDGDIDIRDFGVLQVTFGGRR